jgi:hypothetical protein
LPCGLTGRGLFTNEIQGYFVASAGGGIDDYNTIVEQIQETPLGMFHRAAIPEMQLYTGGVINVSGGATAQVGK